MKFSLPLIAGVIIVIAMFGLLLALPSEQSSTESNSIEYQTPEEAVPEDPYEIFVYTDKYTYEEGGNVQLTINITSLKAVKDAEIRFFGIKNKYGAFKLKRTEVMNLAEGPNSIKTKTNMPLCSSCAGISPGKYRIYGAIYDNGTQVVNASTEVELME